MRKFLILSFLVIFVLGCESNSPRRSNLEKKSAEEREYLYQINTTEKEVSLGGESAFVSIQESSSSNLILRDIQNAMKQKLEEDLTAKGFSIVKDRVSAYLWIAITAGFDEPTYPIVKTKTLTAKYDPETKKYITYHVESDDKNALMTLVIGASGQAYGRRPQNIAQLSVTAATSEKVMDAIRLEQPKFFSFIEKVPVKPLGKKEKGSPGCSPRFGYEHKGQLKDGEMIYVITLVPAKSPAAKAGLKVNDQILAIDSVPYADFDKDGAADEVYNKGTEVPVKILRDGKEVRLKIKSQISCE